MPIWDDAPANSREVFEHLKTIAKKMRVESYGEIAAAISKREGRMVTAIGLNQPLGFIRDKICRPRGLPWLNVLAVNNQTWFPGDSFLPSDVTFGEDERFLWRGAVLAVFGYPWDSVKID